MLVFENLERARSFFCADYDFVVARGELIEEPLRDAESPIPFPASELLPVMERD